MTCLNCNKELKVSFGKSSKYCSVKCRNDYNKKKAKNKPEKEELYCEICGKLLERQQRKACSNPECKRLYNLRRVKQYKEVYKKPEADIEAKPIKKRKKPKISIAKINELARAEGLNYGAYVAKYGL